MPAMKHLNSVLLTTAMTVMVASELHAATLHDAVGDTVDNLCRYLKSKGEVQISVGQFSGPPQFATTSGPGIVKVFHEHFRRNRIEVVARANIGLKGEYSLTKVGSDGVGVKIKGSLVDSFGDVLADFTFDADRNVEAGTIENVVDEHEDIVQLLGVTTELFPEDGQQDRNRDLKDDILHPTLHVAGSRCAASSQSPYQIEVLVHGQPVSVKLENGLGFVKIDRGQIYSVRIHNGSLYDAAVKLSIDGLSVFAFSDLQEPDGTPKYRFYIIPKGRFIELKGWHKNNSLVNSFLVTKYADSAAASINHSQDIGTITATFFAAWPKGGQRPHDEDFVAKGSGNATGFGPPIKDVVKEAQHDVGRLRASVSIRYAK